MFTISGGTPSKRASLHRYLDECDFPWPKLLPALVSRHRWPFPIELVPEMPGGGIAMFGYAGIVMNQDVGNGQSLLHELGHAVDAMLLTNEDRQRLLAAHKHEVWRAPRHQIPYWEVPIEDYARTFSRIYSPDPYYETLHGSWTDSFARQVTDERLAQIVPFDDIAYLSNEAQEDIALIAELGITRGTAQGVFDPARPITRAEMAQMLARFWRAAEARSPSA